MGNLYFELYRPIDSFYRGCYKLDHMNKANKIRKQGKTHAVPTASFSFDSVALAKRLLAAASERARGVIIRRFGLGNDSERETLEAIGDRSSITRERVRQIEAAGLDAIRASKAFKEAGASFEEIARYIHSLGAIVPEETLLSALGKDEKSRNRFRFFLMVNAAFFRERETNDFLARWHVDHTTAKHIHNALTELYSSLSDTDVISESELLDRFLDELKSVNNAYKNEEVLKRWLSLSKHIGSNPLAEWGRTTAPAIRIKGVRDYAYLAVKRHGSPMHFSEVAKAIGTLFSKKAHIATTHNELIKDPRFVLVGRGLYALTEWGYTPGVVRDVIRETLEEKGPMKKEEIIKRVKRARFVKDNTILVNLNDSRYFKRLKDGRYAAV
ncbi:MAG: RNA polymerase sigma factor RpoD [Syntrophomonadaceae bacterium]|nr:RNA polymerase sigma factor RpoD [Bacillota bacterium]